MLSGSFGRNLELVQWAGRQLAGQGVEVLAPVFDHAIDPEAAFIRLDTDDADKSPYQLQLDYYRTIRRADMHVVVNPGGRVGLSAAAEMAFAAICGTARVALDEPVQSRQLDRDYNRHHPEIWFTDDLSAAEQSALTRLPWRGGLWQQLGWAGLDLQECKRHSCMSTPMAQDHPDRPILSGVYKRVLRDLREQHA